jgi:hypothetical protein
LSPPLHRRRFPQALRYRGSLPHGEEAAPFIPRTAVWGLLAEINNALARALARRWQAQAPGRVTNYVFRAASMLDHDIIDPTQKNQRVDYVYPILLRLCMEPGETASATARQTGG